MPKVEYIAEADAPGIPKSLTKGAEESLEILNSIKTGMVAKLTPDEAKTARGIKASMSRVAKSKGIKIQIWQADGDDSVYIRRIK